MIMTNERKLYLWALQNLFDAQITQHETCFCFFFNLKKIVILEICTLFFLCWK